MRTYSALLLFENLFDFIPTDNVDMVNLARSIIEPNLLIVESDCGTTLGKFENINFEVEGLVELATDLRLDRLRIENLLSQGIYELATRHTSTCISKNGVCVKCYAATYPDEPVPEINDRVNISPEYLVNAELISAKLGIVTYPIQTLSTTYDKVYVYSEGVKLISGTDYSISNDVLTLSVGPAYDKNIVIRCIKNDTFPFIVWLANTFSGAIFGMDPLPSQPLPVRSLLLSSLLTENRLQLISEYISDLKTIPESYITFIDTIRDPLEKALYMLALYCLYSNVTS
jgi:hypothetical protein